MASDRTRELAKKLFSGLREDIERNLGLAKITTNSQTGVDVLAKTARLRVDTMEKDAVDLLDAFESETKAKALKEIMRWKQNVENPDASMLRMENESYWRGQVSAYSNVIATQFPYEMVKAALAAPPTPEVKK